MADVKNKEVKSKDVKSKEVKNKNTEKKKAPKKPNAIVRWWKETIGELRRVTWPEKEDAWRMTKIVLAVVLIMATFLGVIDFAFSRLISAIIG